MRVTATVRRISNEKILNRIEFLYDLGIKEYRFNFAKVEGNDQLEKLFFEDIAEVKQLRNDIKVMIDIPYPGKNTSYIAWKKYSNW